MHDDNWPPKIKYRMFRSHPKRLKRPTPNPFSFYKEATILLMIIAFIIGLSISAAFRLRF